MNEPTTNNHDAISRSRLISRPPPVMTGTCEMCGGHNRELTILAMPDYIGWTCKECIEQIGKSVPRRYVSTGEESEPAE